MTYRLRVELTYTTVNNANQAVSSINAALAAASRPETATRTGTQVDLLIEGIATQTEAVDLRNALTSAWGANARSGGRASCVRVD